MTTTRVPATIPAADLAPGDTFLSPTHGEPVEFVRWSKGSLAGQEGVVLIRTANGQRFRHLDPAAIVNLEVQA